MTRRQKRYLKSIERGFRSTKWSQFGGFGASLWLKVVWGEGFMSRALGYLGSLVALHTCAVVVNGAFREEGKGRMGWMIAATNNIKNEMENC